MCARCTPWSGHLVHRLTPQSQNAPLICLCRPLTSQYVLSCHIGNIFWIWTCMPVAHACHHNIVVLMPTDCFPNLLTCLGYFLSLCFGANLTRLTFSLEDVLTVAAPGEWNCCACTFTIVIFMAISTASSKVRFVILPSFSWTAVWPMVKDWEICMDSQFLNCQTVVGDAFVILLYPCPEFKWFSHFIWHWFKKVPSTSSTVGLTFC